MLVTGPHGDAQVLSSHSDEHQLVAHARSRISEDIGYTPVPFEASITVFNADAGFGESRVRRFLCWCQLISGFPLLFSLAFDGRHDHSIPDLQPLKATVRANGQGLLAGPRVAQRDKTKQANSKENEEISLKRQKGK